MGISTDFAQQNFINLIKSGDFSVLTNKNISVAEAQQIIDKYYEPPIEEIMQEAVQNELIKPQQEPYFRDQLVGTFLYGSGAFYALSGHNSFMSRSSDFGEDFFREGNMVVDQDRVKAELYFTMQTTQSSQLDWADKNNFEGKYLTTSDCGLITLRIGKPMLAARNIHIDVRPNRKLSRDENHTSIKNAIEKGRTLVSMGLNDALSRADDPYVSGRHYCSVKILLNSASLYYDDLVKTSRNSGLKMLCRTVLGTGGEVIVKTHDLDYLDTTDNMTVTLSAQGQDEFDSSSLCSIFFENPLGFTELVADAAKSDVDLTAKIIKLALKP